MKLIFKASGSLKSLIPLQAGECSFSETFKKGLKAKLGS